MSLLQRIRSPFSEGAGDTSAETDARGPVVGTVLRDRREELGLDLDSIGEALCIKPIYLAALEQGRAQDLPGPTYAIGFVRAYAQYLGFDGEQILDAYKAESADARARPDLTLPVPLGMRSLPGGAILLVGLIIALCGYGTWYYLATGERDRPERVAAVPVELQQTLRGAAPLTAAPPNTSPATSPGSYLGAAPGSTSDQLPPPPGMPPSLGFVGNPAAAAPPPANSSMTSPTAVAKPVAGAPAVLPPAATTAAKPTVASVVPPSPSASSATANAKPAAMPAALPSGDAAKSADRVEIRAVADCWIQVRAADDQSIVFSRVLKAGETYHVPRGGLFLRTGNAGALAIAVDGKPVPAIGGVGTLRRNVSLDPDPLLAGTAVHG